MRKKLLEVLVCPACHGPLDCEATETASDGDIVSGELTCKPCKKSHPIVNSIPRFVSSDNYASSFGLQWNMFRAEQIDSINGTDLSKERFYPETEWSPEWMKGKWILDAGCGAGRFLDVASLTGAEVVGIDISNAVEAAHATLKERTNLHFVQASIYELPFKNSMDGVYCLGVIQHTPDPRRSLRALPETLKPGGKIAVAVYPRRRWTYLYSKYLVRPITTRMSEQGLLTTVKATMPVLFPLTEVLFRIPFLSRFFQFLIPVSNYVGYKDLNMKDKLTMKERYEWAVMDTYDMLAPAYDQPQRPQVVARTLAKAGIVDLKRTVNYLAAYSGRKPGGPAEKPAVTTNNGAAPAA